MVAVNEDIPKIRAKYLARERSVGLTATLRPSKFSEDNTAEPVIISRGPAPTCYYPLRNASRSHAPLPNDAEVVVQSDEVLAIRCEAIFTGAPNGKFSKGLFVWRKVDGKWGRPSTHRGTIDL